jgi:two-component sensor histidine kinase
MGNSLQLAANFLLFEQARLRDPAARAALGEAAARLSAVGQLHRFLCAHDPATNVDFERFLSHLCGFICGSTGLRCTLDAAPLTMAGGMAQQLGIVINELAMNATKHAYRPGEAGALRVECRTQGRRLILTVADEGSGLDKDFATGTDESLGATIVGAIVRELRGSLETHNDHGAVFTIVVPLPPLEPRISRSFAPKRR